MSDNTLIHTLKQCIAHKYEPALDTANLTSNKVSNLFIKTAKQVADYYNQQHENTPIEDIRDALSHVPADGRDTWIKMAMSVKSYFGDDGFDTWNDWSATANNYSASDAVAVWKSIKQSGKIGLGTLFYIAKQHGYKSNGSYTATPLTPQEIAVQEAKQKADEEAQKKLWATAALKAQVVWKMIIEAQPNEVSHAYLDLKGINAHGAKIYPYSMVISGMNCKGALVIPMWLNEKITGLEFIQGSGKEKRFQPSCQKGSYLIGEVVTDKPICIAEGFATGASIHEATGYPVLIAFDAGSLPIRAKEIRAKYPDADIVLCADKDESGKGLRKATEAAVAVDGWVVAPPDSVEVSNE